MKIISKISTTIFLLGLLCGICAVPIMIYGFPCVLNAYCTTMVTQTGDWLTLIGLAGLLLGFLISVLTLIRIGRQVVRPLREAATFSDRLANGESPARLSEKGMGDNEIQILFSALNLLRDRQLNLNSKLKLSLSREAEARRGAESHNQLQLRIISKILPEMRIPLGVIKGFTRVLLQEMESKNPDSAETRRLLEEIDQRIGSLSRQIDRLYEIAELSRDRWNSFDAVEFNTAEFVRELVTFCQTSLQEREVALMTRFSASAPEWMVLDRELLQQLLMIMIFALGRAAAPGENLTLSCLRESGKVIFEVRDSVRAPLREPLVESYRKLEANAESEQLAMDSLSIPILGLIFVRDLASRLGGALRVDAADTSNAILRFEISDSCVAKCGEFHHVCDSSTRMDFSEIIKPGETVEKGETPLRVLHGSEVAEAPYLLKRLLGADNIEVSSFREAPALIEAAKQEKFDCLLLSPTLKNCELPALIKELRDLSDRRDLPVIVIGCDFPTELRRDLKLLDQVYLLSLPVDFDTLCQIIHKTAGSRS